MPPSSGMFILAEPFDGSDKHQQRWREMLQEVTRPVAEGGLGLTTNKVKSRYVEAVDAVCRLLVESGCDPDLVNEEAFHLLIWKHLCLALGKLTTRPPSRLDCLLTLPYPALGFPWEDDLVHCLEGPKLAPPSPVYKAYHEGLNAANLQASLRESISRLTTQPETLQLHSLPPEPVAEAEPGLPRLVTLFDKGKTKAVQHPAVPPSSSFVPVDKGKAAALAPRVPAFDQGKDKAMAPSPAPPLFSKVAAGARPLDPSAPVFASANAWCPPRAADKALPETRAPLKEFWTRIMEDEDLAKGKMRPPATAAPAVPAKANPARKPSQPGPPGDTRNIVVNQRGPGIQGQVDDAGQCDLPNVGQVDLPASVDASQVNLPVSLDGARQGTNQGAAHGTVAGETVPIKRGPSMSPDTRPPKRARGSSSDGGYDLRDGGDRDPGHAATPPPPPSSPPADPAYLTPSPRVLGWPGSEAVRRAGMREMPAFWESLGRRITRAAP